MTDGIQATAAFGQEVPVPSTVIQPIQQGGLNIQPQTTFNYRTIGVNIAITPRTHPNDEVTLGLEIELSTLAGTGFDGLPAFGRRNVTTTIRLRDGETNILAGLIRDDERTTRETIPGLGDIPIIGQLFGRTRREAEQTDVVVMLTPHIIRVLDISEDDLRPLLLPNNLSGATVFETEPIVPPQPIIRGGGGGGGGGGEPLPSFPVLAGPPSGLLPATRLDLPRRR
jgi:general secretion pathway protein D